MEADLQRFYGIDYRDRWRGDLTLRRLLTLIRYLPGDSAVSRSTGHNHWSTEAHLLDELRMTLVGTKKKPAKPHPQRPRRTKKAPDAKRRRQLEAGQHRAAARRRAIEAGEIT